MCLFFWCWHFSYYPLGFSLRNPFGVANLGISTVSVPSFSGAGRVQMPLPDDVFGGYIHYGVVGDDLKTRDLRSSRSIRAQRKQHCFPSSFLALGRKYCGSSLFSIMALACVACVVSDLIGFIRKSLSFSAHLRQDCWSYTSFLRNQIGNVCLLYKYS